MILASNNQGKLKEFARLFTSLNIDIEPQSKYDVPEVEETGLSFIENALIKARHAARLTKQATIADDSGLVVLALNGAPGIYSARYSGAGATDQKNIDCLLDDMQTIQDRRAFFYCVIVKVEHADDPIPLIATGRCDGEIALSQSGSQGFGYDPVFYLSQFQKTMAEITPELKNKISHRAHASQHFLEQLKKSHDNF